MYENFNDNISENISDDCDSSLEEASRHIKKRSAIALLFDILLTGTPGWKRLRRTRMAPEQTASGCFYPILALAALCRFADWFYLPDFDLSATLISSASIFASFFFSYFAVQVVCNLFFPFDSKSKTETSYFKLIVQYSLASLALFFIPAELFPIVEPIAVFLPIWTIFIITKGVRFLRLPEVHRNRCMVTIVITTVAMPYLFLWLCEKIF